MLPPAAVESISVLTVSGDKYNLSWFDFKNIIEMDTTMN